MGTRSFIAHKTADGYRAIYCHWDGYPSWNGRILYQHYSDPAKLDALLDLGDISSLGTGLGEKHDFNDSGNDDVTTAYGRDRGDTGTEARAYPTLAMLFAAANGCWAEYVYVLENGRWGFTPIGAHGKAAYPNLKNLEVELIDQGEIENVS